MKLIKGNMYRKAEFGITYPKSLVASQTVDGEDYIFFTIECDYNNELSSNGIIIEPYSIDEVVYKDTVPRRISHVFVRNEPRGAFKYIGDIDVIKPHDARRNLVVVK